MGTGGCNARGVVHGANAAMTTYFMVQSGYIAFAVLDICVSGVSILAGCNAPGAGHGANAAMTTYFRVHGRYTTLTVLEFRVSGVSIWMNLHGDPTIANAACSTSISVVCYRPRHGRP